MRTAEPITCLSSTFAPSKCETFSQYFSKTRSLWPLACMACKFDPRIREIVAIHREVDFLFSLEGRSQLPVSFHSNQNLLWRREDHEGNLMKAGKTHIPSWIGWYNPIFSSPFVFSPWPSFTTIYSCTENFLDFPRSIPQPWTIISWWIRRITQIHFPFLSHFYLISANLLHERR